MSAHQQFTIGNRTAGIGQPCFIIAEIGLSHDGSLGIAHAFIDAIADTGVDAVKFQTHIADAESTKKEKFRVKVFPQDDTRKNYWKRTQFTEPEWRELKLHVEERGLVFLSSPFSMEAVHMLENLGVQGWKIASGETNNLAMLKGMIDTGLPFLVSSGMSYYRELDETLQLLREHDRPFILYQCTNRYPCPPEHIGINVIDEFKKRYDCPVGLSDHSGKICAGIAAHALGICSLEVHVTFHRKCFGPDVPASLTLEELELLVQSIRYMETVYAHPIQKDEETKTLEELRGMFTKSIVPAFHIAKGTRFTKENLTVKKPAIGIPAKEIDKVYGKRAKRDIEKDEFFTWDDITE